MSSDPELNSPTSQAVENMAADALLLTPGPLTTSATVKRAMLRDLGSRDREFIALNRRVCDRLLTLARASDGYTCVPIQGSGTFAVEAMLATVLPTGGKLLNLVNGAYGYRIQDICRYLKRASILQESSEHEAIDVEMLNRTLAEDKSITHVSVVYCETTSGILNPLADIAGVVERHGRALLVDAMSAFGALPLNAEEHPFTALAASSNKCLQGVPGMAFCLVRNSDLQRASGNAHSLSLDLYAQAEAMAKNGQWRFTPPVHCLLALDQALIELDEEGGQSARLQRYAENRRLLVEGMRALGFQTLLPDALQAPVIVTFLMPSHPVFAFQRFYDALHAKGFVIYPGKITRADTFRIGCIGDLGAEQMREALDAIEITLREMGINNLDAG